MTDSVTINTPDFHRNVFVELHALQRQGVACDVILAAVDGEIMAHKVILMAVSKYFHRRLTSLLPEEKHPKLFIQDVSITELASIVKYIYTGKLLVSTDSIDATLQVCEMLELDGVIEGLKDVLAQKPLEISAVYASRNVDALKSIPSTRSACLSNAVIPLNSYKNVSSVERATLHDKQPDLLQNLHTGMIEPVIETRLINKGHRVAHSEDEQLRLPSHLTERDLESDTTRTDKLDSGTISRTSVTNQTELDFKASANKISLEHSPENLNSEGSSRYERQTENESTTVCMDDSYTITETDEKTDVNKEDITVKPSWFVNENPRAATGIANCDRALTESSEFSEKHVKNYSEKTLHESSDPRMDFKSTLSVPEGKKRKVGIQCKPVVRLRKLTKHEIMSWSTYKTQVKGLKKKGSFPRIRLVERGNTNESSEKKRRKGDVVASKSVCTDHEVADSMFCRRYLGKTYVINCTICNMKFRTVHELHHHFAEDIHQNNQQVKAVSERETCSICEARFQMAQLLNDHGSEDDSCADLRLLSGSLSNRSPMNQKRLEPALRKQSKSGEKGAQNYKEVPTQKMFRCDVCQFKTTKGYEYRFHMKRVHGKSPLYRCSAEGCSFSTYLISKLTSHENCQHFRIKVHKPVVRGRHKTDQDVKTVKRWGTALGKVDNNSNGKNENRGSREADEEIPTFETEQRYKKRQRNSKRITVSGRKTGRPLKNCSITERSAFILRSSKDRKIKTDVSVPDSQTSITDFEQVDRLENETFGSEDTSFERDKKDVKCTVLLTQDERHDSEHSEGQRWRQSEDVPSGEEMRECVSYRNLAPGDYIVPDLKVIKMEKGLWGSDKGSV